jgi:hypothetical protein
MISWLKQNTATTLLLGPFVDSAGAALTALTIAQANVLLWKEGGTTLAQKNEATTCTHRSNGMYTCPVNTTDTNTLGVLQVSVNASGALPWAGSYLVVADHVHVGFVTTSGFIGVDVRQLNSSGPAVTKLTASAGQIYTGTVDNTGFTATTTVLDASDITTATADHWIGRIIVFSSGTLAGQATKITDYELASGRGRFTYQTLTSAPGNGTTFVIV